MQWSTAALPLLRSQGGAVASSSRVLDALARCFTTGQVEVPSTSSSASLLSLQEDASSQPGPSNQDVQQSTPAEKPRPRLIPKVAAAAPKKYPLLEALQIVKANSRVKFDETVEAHVRLKVDPRRGDQMVRGAAPLPVPVGRAPRICVFADGPQAEAAKAAGADVIGDAALADQLLASKGKDIDFDRCIATPAMMKVLVKLGKVLGPKGLMPNPKVGTLTEDVAAAVWEMRRGRLEVKMDRTGNVHVPLGKVSFLVEDLQLNMGAFVKGLLAAKPEAIKGGLPKYLANVTLCSTMGRGVQVQVGSLEEAVEAAKKALSEEGSSGQEGK